MQSSMVPRPLLNIARSLDGHALSWTGLRL